MEAAALLLTIFGIAWGFYIYYNRQSPDYKDEKNYSIQKFEYLKALNTSLIDKITLFAYRYDCFDDVITPGITFRTTLEKLLEVRDKLLTEENYNAMIQTKAPLVNIKSITENLKIQIDGHSQLATSMELLHNHLKQKFGTEWPSAEQMSNYYNPNQKNQ